MDSFLIWVRAQTWFMSLNKDLARGSPETVGVYLVLGVFIVAILVVILLLAGGSDDYEE
jgi:hypothetical protein